MNLWLAARWLAPTILVAGSALAVMLLASRSLRTYALFVRSPVETTGTVTVDPPPGTTTVFYRFEAGGGSWPGQFQADRVRTDHRAGHRLPVFYLAADPAINSTVKPTPGDLEARRAVWWLGGAFTVGAVGLLAHRWLTKSKREPLLLDTSQFEGNWWVP